MSTVCEGENRRSVTIENDKIPYYSNSLILKARPHTQSDNYLLVSNKLDKNQTFKLEMLVQGAFNDYNALGSQSCDTNDCNKPEFVVQMEDKLFAKIEGVVDFNFKGRGDGKSGYFLLLNINGRPMGCFTFEGEGISQMVGYKNCFSIE